jgi:hypothetical protein
MFRPSQGDRGLPARVVEAPAAVTVIGRDELARQASHGQLPRALAATPGAVERSSSARGIGFSPSEELTGQPRVEHTLGVGVDALRFAADGMTTVTMWVAHPRRSIEETAFYLAIRAAI